VIPAAQAGVAAEGMAAEAGVDFLIAQDAAALTLEPSIVYEAWCSQRPGGIIVIIEEVYGKPIHAGQSFSAAHIVGYFNTIDAIHAVNNRDKGHTALSVDGSGWRLVE
jgi:hypothetical protein